MFNNRNNFFLEHSVSLSQESNCDNVLLNRYCIYFRRARTGMSWIYTTYLNCIPISKEWLSGATLFQEATYSNLMFSRVLFLFQTSTCKYRFCKYNEIIGHSNCSHSFEQRPVFYYKRAVATHSIQF